MQEGGDVVSVLYRTIPLHVNFELIQMGEDWRREYCLE